MRHARAARIVLLAALAAASPSPAADLGVVKARGELRVLAVVDDPTDEFFTDRPGGGLDRELLESFASFQKVRLVVVPAPGWDKLVPMLQEGRGDVVAGRFTATEARRRAVAFTAEVFPTRNVVVTRKPHRGVGTVPGALAWAVRKEDAALLAALDDFIAGTRRTPTWGRLVVKYFGEEAPEILKRAREEAER